MHHARHGRWSPRHAIRIARQADGVMAMHSACIILQNLGQVGEINDGRSRVEAQQYKSPRVRDIRGEGAPRITVVSVHEGVHSHCSILLQLVYTYLLLQAIPPHMISSVRAQIAK